MTCINIPIKQSIHTHMDMHRQTHFASTSSSRCLCIHLPVCVGLLPLSNACIVYSCASYACVCVNFHSDVIVFLRCGSGRLFFFHFHFQPRSSLPFFILCLTRSSRIKKTHTHTHKLARLRTCVCVCLYLHPK